MRASLYTSPILALPDLAETAAGFSRDTNASDNVLAEVLSRAGVGAHEHMVTYGSKTLSKHKQSCCVLRKKW